MKLATVITSFNFAEADLIRSRLDAAGFHPVIANENASSWLGCTMSTATQLRIEIPEDELADAREFLDAPVE